MGGIPPEILGINGGVALYLTRLLLGTDDPISIDASKITNLRADAGISPIAGLGAPVTEPVLIHIENQLSLSVENTPSVLNHSMRVLADSLAVYDLFVRFDPSLSAETILSLLQASSNKPGTTLESAVSALGGILGIVTAPGLTTQDRSEFWTAVVGVQQATDLLGGVPYSLESLVDKTSANLAVSAQAATPTGLAYRYALTQLDVFVVAGTDEATTGALYAPHNTAAELDLYDPDTGLGTLTDIYLADRARMLALSIRLNVADAGFEPNSVEGDTSFIDIDRTLRLDAGLTSVLGTPRSFVKFGSDATEVSGEVDGGPHHDRLYGAGGADVIHGFAGDDRVLGGAGADLLFGRLMQNPSITARLTPPQHGETMPAAPA